MPELECVPMGLCSWNYRVTGGEFGEAEVRLETLFENGAILVNGRELKVAREGLLSSKWTLEWHGELLGTAVRTGLVRTTIQFQAGGIAYSMEGEVFSRNYRITMDGAQVGEIVPVHAFTRRATMRCQPVIPAPAQLFAFWMAALLWRRTSESG